MNGYKKKDFFFVIPVELKICGKAIALNYSRFNGEGFARERMGKMNINIPIMWSLLLANASFIFCMAL